MNTNAPNEETLLEQALAFASRSERLAYLKNACGGNEQLRARVQSLIEAHEAAGGFLAEKAAFVASTVRIEPQLDEPPGTLIGRYKLLQKIGEGGMGMVYMAEQEEPVRRRVPLKIITLGMDTKRLSPRFEAVIIPFMKVRHTLIIISIAALLAGLSCKPSTSSPEPKAEALQKAVERQPGPQRATSRPERLQVPAGQVAYVPDPFGPDGAVQIVGGIGSHLATAADKLEQGTKRQLLARSLLAKALAASNPDAIFRVGDQDSLDEAGIKLLVRAAFEHILRKIRKSDAGFRIIATGQESTWPDQKVRKIQLLFEFKRPLEVTIHDVGVGEIDQLNGLAWNGFITVQGAGPVRINSDGQWRDWMEWNPVSNGLKVEIKARNLQSSWGTVVFESRVGMTGFINHDRGTLQLFLMPPDEDSSGTKGRSGNSPAH